MASRTRRKTNAVAGYRRWDAAEEKKLYEFSVQGLSDSEIAEKMDRSVSAIGNRRFFLRETGEWERIPKK